MQYLKPGEQIRAEMWNDMVRAISTMRDGPAISGDDVRLFRADEDFEETDVPGVFSGDCYRYEFQLSDGTYIDYGDAEEVFCLEDVTGPPSEDDKFYALFNRGSGRWERVGGGGSACPAINTIWQVVIWGALESLGGTFKLQYKTDDPTDDLDHDVSAGDMQAALEASDSIGAGNVQVTGGPHSWTIEFIEDLAHKAAGPLAINGADLTGPYLGFTVNQLQSGHK